MPFIFSNLKIEDVASRLDKKQLTTFVCLALFQNTKINGIKKEE